MDLFEGGVVVSHEGPWRAGANGAKAGLVMPGIILLGAAYQQEVAPPVAMDRAEIVSMSQTLVTPAGVFENVLETVETTPLEPNANESRWYAAGVGLIKDDRLELVKYGFLKPTAGGH